MLTGPLVPLSGEALLSDLAEAMGDVSTLLRDAGSTGPDDALLARNLSIKRGTAPDLASASAPAFTVQHTINSKLLLHHETAQGRYQHTLLWWEPFLPRRCLCKVSVPDCRLLLPFVARIYVLDLQYSFF